MITLPTITGLGTTWRIDIFDKISAEKAQVVHDDMRIFITTFQDRYTRFNPDSIIGTLNAANKFPNPDAETIEILEYGINLFHDTHEVFNFLVGEAMEQNGYDALYSFTPKGESLATPNPTRSLSITPENIILSVGQVDIGGYGKGYLIDMIALRLQQVHDLECFLINGGGDMYGTSDFGKPITIYLEHPSEANTYLQETTLLNEGFAASSTQKRRWESAGKVYTHIVDTKAGQSSQSGLAVFVKALSAKTADAWATTLLISAPENHTDMMNEKSIRAAIYDEQQKTLKYYGEF